MHPLIQGKLKRITTSFSFSRLDSVKWRIVTIHLPHFMEIVKIKVTPPSTAEIPRNRTGMAEKILERKPQPDPELEEFNRNGEDSPAMGEVAFGN